MQSKDDEIKSALEIALERAQKLGALSAGEKQRLKDEELIASGEALAKRYLNGLPLCDVEVELGRRKEEDRQIISRHLLLRLVDTIDIKHIAGNERILAAIQHLSGNSGVVQSIRYLLEEYENAMEKARQENWSSLETAGRNELEQNGFRSGTVWIPIIRNAWRR